MPPKVEDVTYYVEMWAGFAQGCTVPDPFQHFIVLPQCAKVFRSHGVHFTIPTQHISIYYATIRNVCQRPTIPMERHS